MKAAIVGYGAMGKEIESVLVARGHTVAVRFDPKAGLGDLAKVTSEALVDADIAIEFALADAVADNARAYVAAGCPAVVGTTGWDEQRTEIRSLVEKRIGYLWGSNFSIGANIFFNLVAAAAKAIDSFDEYDIAVHEVHHNKKQDSPSGTALTVAERILGNLDRKSHVFTEAAHRRIDPEELHVSSTRVGTTPGTHTVIVDSAADTIELIHRARSRQGFAMGAVRAAEWLVGRTGFLNVSDFIDDVLGVQGA